MNHRRLRLAAALGALLLMLTGCGTKKNPEGGGNLHLSELEIQEEPAARETDLSQRFADYFQYCFGEDASFSYQETDDSGYDRYLLEYKDRTGTLRTSEREIQSYRLRGEAEWDMSEDAWYSYDMEALTYWELEAVFLEGFDSLLEQELGVHHSPTDGWEYNGEVVQIMTAVSTDSYYAPDDAVRERALHAHIAPGTGWQVCNADWKSVAADERMVIRCIVNIAYDADADAYTEKLNRIIEAYEHAGETPQNYHFVLQQNDTADGGGTHTVTEKGVAFGEEIDLSKMGEDYGYTVYSEHMKERMAEKYK
ncbi:MAG: hypothetical protein IJ060_02210 [Oscillospiraceae bacterium]|nr:hypothetical protein [Oscillospiraceae bacterium]